MFSLHVNKNLLARQSQFLAASIQRSYASAVTSKSIKKQKVSTEVNAQKKLKERQEQLKKKFEDRQKVLAQKQQERINKKAAQLKKWEFEEKIRKMREVQAEKDRKLQAKQRAKEVALKEKEKLKAITQKLNQKAKIAQKKEETPKRALPAMFFYLKDNFASTKQSLIEQQKPAGVTDVARVVRDKFAALSGEEKQKYLDLAKQDKERYANEMNAYKQKKQANKRPLSSFLLYCSENRQTVQQELKQKDSSLSGKELATSVVKRLGERWASLSQEEKDKFKQQYEAAKAQHDAKLGKKE